jgi:hypothetical protein
MIFRNPFRPKPKVMPLGLQPTTGEIYAHLSENSATGLRRNLYWNARIDFEPVQLDGEELDCSLAIEWLTWPIQSWRGLDGMGFAKVSQRDLVECSLYLFEEHHWATLRHFELGESGPATFEADFSAIAQVDDGSGLRLFEVSARCNLTFTSIVVVGSNLQPELASQLEAQAAVAKFISLEHLAPPRSEGWRYVLEPII